MPVLYSFGVMNIRIQIQETPHSSTKASRYCHEGVSCLELVDGADVEQLPVVHAIEHPCAVVQLEIIRRGQMAYSEIDQVKNE